MRHFNPNYLLICIHYGHRLSQHNIPMENLWHSRHLQVLDVDITTFWFFHTSFAMPIGYNQRKSLCFEACPYDAQIEDPTSRCSSHNTINNLHKNWWRNSSYWGRCIPLSIWLRTRAWDTCAVVHLWTRGQKPTSAHF